MHPPPAAVTVERTPLSSLAVLGAALVGSLGCNPLGEHYPTQVLASDPPVQAQPLSGGTLLALHDGVTAVASDPDRDAVGIVDLANQVLVGSVALAAGDEPGRLVEDGAGRVHVALRRGGAVATIDVHLSALVDRRDVCPAPRGIAYDPTSDSLHVACAGGELVTLPAGGGAATRRLRLDRDLRDVVVDGDNLLVSRFRTAEILTVDVGGAIADRRQPVGVDVTVQGSSQFLPSVTNHFEPAVAWRMSAVPGGGVMVVHQRAQTTAIDIGLTAPPNPYGNATGEGCDGGITQSTLTLFQGSGPPGASALRLPSAALPIDVAVSPDGSRVAVVAAGSNALFEGALSDAMASGEGECNSIKRTAIVSGPVAVVYDAAGSPVVQTRNPPTLVIHGRAVDLIPVSPFQRPVVVDPGHELFHTPPGGIGSLACASCHPEGREDGRVWQFQPIGPRRTQSLAGDITETAPFHWGGDLTTFGDLMGEVFVRRMGGEAENLAVHGEVLTRWLSTIPAPPASPPEDPAAVERGRALFHDGTVGCVTCHAGAKGTNDKTVDVGTGEALQVPWLVGVAWRAPFLHDGSAPTLFDRFGPGGGGDKHGHTSQLSPAQVADLVAYLETL